MKAPERIKAMKFIENKNNKTIALTIRRHFIDEFNARNFHWAW